MCFAFLGDCISFSEGSDVCSEDDASDTDRLYNIFAICRKAMDEDADFQCKREPAIIEAGKCAEKETLPKGLRERSSSKNQEDEVKDDGDEQAELHYQRDANIGAFCPCLHVYSLF